jgi:Ca-activated chloride channel homolog
LKRTVVIFFLLFAASLVHAQYYLRGQINDENKNPLQNVRILLNSNGYLYYTGSDGTFGILTPLQSDSLTITVDGFQTVSMRLDTRQYQTIVLKLLAPPPAPPKKALLSATKNLRPEDWRDWTIGSETYSSLLENQFVLSSKFPETGFAMNIDKASYSNIRRLLNMDNTIPPDAVRIEEMLNYFNFDYTSPLNDSVFTTRSYISKCPWNENNQLLYLHVCAKKIDYDKVPPANLVFLIDISGSMDMPNRLPLLKSAFSLMVNNLRDVDTVSIVVYGSTVGVWLPPTPGSEKNSITQSIEELYPGGATPGEAGINAAYRIASNQFISGGNNRVILATDGDFNVGQSSEEDLEKLIVSHKQRGIYLTCLGVGMGNYKDSKLQVLAERGNGNFAYLDDEKEAEKVLMQEFTQTIFSVADDASIDVNFDTTIVKNYRLIGFDNKIKYLEDSVSELQGGEIGSGHSLIAMFEITPKENTVPDPEKSLAKLTLHYKHPGDSVDNNVIYYCPDVIDEFKQLPSSLRFATSIAMFGGVLRNSEFMRKANWNTILEMAKESQDPQNSLHKEFIELVEKAKKIYPKNWRSKKRTE